MAGLDFLTQKYDRNLFLNFLRGFLTDKFETIEAEYISTSSEFQYIRKIYKLGEDKNLDLTVYEVEHHSENDPRVSLTREIFKFNRMHLVKKALVIFHLPRSDNFRLSLITAEVVGLKGKKTIVMESNPRRYSYLLGKRVHTKTPQQFLARPLSAGEDEKDVSLFGSLLKRFSVEVLTKQFYKELFDWYSWALSEKMGVKYPNDTSINTDDRQIEEHLIRLITRLLFVWFIKQKRLIPEAIFDADRLADILENFNPHSETEGIYYNAILQNLFFATLNRPISERAFATASTAGKSDGKEHYGIKTLFRDDNKKSWFKKSQREIVDLFKQVPFLNGGLFECLDKEQDSKGKVKYYDGFSRDNKNKQGMLVRAFIPNQLFFAEEHVESLPEYDKKQKKPINKERKVLGLITILKKYNFTVEENTPNDVDVALDPELLGKVFENLLGSYNPETRKTARKQSGSFYTPREIVNYMVDESMIAYLKQTVGDYETEYRKLLTAIDTDTKISLTEKVQAEIYNALRKCKILDPACGSGAFPMGVLLKIITIIQHLPLPNSISLFDLKLHLIENCIFGIDIQPIAVQISKLRFFISLICEQKPSNSMEENYGIKPLPNLETKFVAANTLIGLKQSNQQGNLFEDPQIEVIKRDLWQVRHEHFMANAPKQKKECRYKDTQLREKLARLLEINKMFIPKDAAHLAAWNPYDQNTSSPFFDAEWMFGIADGFNIVIGNPPYVQLPSLKNNPIQKIYSDADFKTYEPMGDIYFLFYEQGINLLKNHGHLCYITSNKWLRVGCGESLRKYFSIYNPKVLVDLGGNIFDAATVDTNILVIEKAPYENQTLSYAFKDRSKNMGDLISQDGISMTFSKEAWVILSPIEQSIKAKIEKIGTPLKDWDISIYRGVLTGCNEAFIIDGKKRAELIAKDARSAEIIRPILRGRDIKRYSYNFADLHLIAAHNGTDKEPRVNINKYPAVKEHLDKYIEQITNREDKGDTPYNLRSCAYMDDFSKQKIVWAELARTGNAFTYDTQEMYVSNTGYILLLNAHFSTCISYEYVLGVLNSKIILFYLDRITSKFDETGWRWLRQYVELLPIPIINRKQQKPIALLVKKCLTNRSKKLLKQINLLIYKLYELSNDEIKYIEAQYL